MGYIDQIVESRPVAQTVSLTVIAQDPSVTISGRILTEALRIPAEPLDPGPRGARFHIVDYDGDSGSVLDPARLDPEDRDAFAEADDETLLADPAFRAQNVYAIAARTLATFESALGRRVGWAFRGQHLFLVPRAFPEANAYYSPEDGAIFFGFVPEGSGEVQTALSYDIVAHETTHAILDGLRPRFAEPGLPDQPAFHEALADIVALLSVFSLPNVVANLLGEPNQRGRLAQRALTEDALAGSALFTLAEQLGVAGERGSGLRRSVELAPSTAWREMRAFQEVHRRGEVLVAAVMRTMLSMWHERLEPITGPDGADSERVVEEGTKAAGHLLRMMIRGLDYMPPVELEFEDVVDAVLKADEVVAPDDDHGYRAAFAEAFGAFGIERPQGRIIDLTRDPARAPTYERMNFVILRSDKDEVFRFLWENAHVFGINRELRTRVEAVKPSARVGPDGLIVNEVVADYTQSLELTVGELEGHDVEVPPGLRRGTDVQVWGGGVLVFDQFGRAKYHQTKPLEDWKRQAKRLKYLAGHGLRDRSHRFGFTLSTPRGQRFAALHVADDRAGEDW